VGVERIELCINRRIVSGDQEVDFPGKEAMAATVVRKRQPPWNLATTGRELDTLKLVSPTRKSRRLGLKHADQVRERGHSSRKGPNIFLREAVHVNTQDVTPLGENFLQER
jgi:hypothetical protein